MIHVNKQRPAAGRATTTSAPFNPHSQDAVSRPTTPLATAGTLLSSPTDNAPFALDPSRYIYICIAVPMFR
jgi:hypothetical protein